MLKIDNNHNFIDQVFILCVKMSPDQAVRRGDGVLLKQCDNFHIPPLPDASLQPVSNSAA